jgi:hypothetical protein
MKDEYKILIGAIVVILIVLIGFMAFGSPGNPGPSVSPIASSTANPTATAVPGGEGGSGGTPSATPTVVPTATPAPTPTAEPESGVKLTEFGYWITYPPLGPETWSTNPPPDTNSGNVVYFDPTSASATAGSGNTFQGAAHLHRDGNLVGTVNVTLHVASDDYSAAEYTGTYTLSNVVYLTDGGGNFAGDVVATFAPDVADVYIGIGIYPNPPESVEALQALAGGSLKLTITNVNGGFHAGDGKDFTLGVDKTTVVHFWRDWGYIDTSGGSLHPPGAYIHNISQDADNVYVGILVQRNGGTSGAMPVALHMDTNLPAGAVTYDPFTFNPSDPEGILTIAMDRDYVYDGASYYVEMYIDDDDDYAVGDFFNYFRVEINPTF